GIRDRNVTGVQTCALPISEQHEALNLLGSGERAILTVDLPTQPAHRERHSAGLQSQRARASPEPSAHEVRLATNVETNSLAGKRSEERRVGRESGARRAKE